MPPANYRSCEKRADNLELTTPSGYASDVENRQSILNGWVSGTTFELGSSKTRPEPVRFLARLPKRAPLRRRLSQHADISGGDQPFDPCCRLNGCRVSLNI